jgi:hypothetical protein
VPAGYGNGYIAQNYTVQVETWVPITQPAGFLTASASSRTTHALTNKQTVGYGSLPQDKLIEYLGHTRIYLHFQGAPQSTADNLLDGFLQSRPFIQQFGESRLG